MAFVEAPSTLQRTIKIPENHFDACRAAGKPYAGNAAGNTKDLLDLQGANVAPKPLPAGFTTKGIVAMAFSVLAALLGLVVITW
jgi:iron transport multicopper oxidase